MFALIGCTKTKQAVKCAASDMYSASQLYTAASAYAAAHGLTRYTLSARHGLLADAVEIEPYNDTLTRLSDLQRLKWASRVYGQIAATIPAGAHIVMLCGKDYREPLTQLLESGGYTVSCPVAGLGIGKQKQFYSLAVKGNHRA